MYEAERLNALEELVIELLRANPALLSDIIVRAGEPDHFVALPREEGSEFLNALRHHRAGVRAAKNQLLRRAAHPHGGPLADDDIDEMRHRVGTGVGTGAGSGG